MASPSSIFPASSTMNIFSAPVSNIIPTFALSVVTIFESCLSDLSNSSLVFVNFHGLRVGEETVLRRDLRDKGVEYKVSRKTLLRRALEGKAEGEVPELSGEVAIAFSKDSTAPAREIYNFQKTHAGILNILGGIFEGKFVNGAYMVELATIPSREVLLGKLAFLFQSPMQRLALAVNEVAKTRN